MVTLWTEARAKDELPTVRVLVGNLRFPGKLSGSMRNYATVSILVHIGKSIHQVWIDRNFDWAEVVKSLNTGIPLRIETYAEQQKQQRGG